MKPCLPLLMSLVLSSCATSPSAFYAAPSKQDTTSLCRTVAETRDPTFKSDVAIELERRGQTPDGCRGRVATQNAVIAGVVVAGAAVAVGVAAHNGAFAGAGGGYYDQYGYAWDEIYGPYGQRMWRCRSTATGMFADNYNCASKVRLDHTWPG